MKNIQWYNETRVLSTLIPMEGNPRQGTAKQAEDLNKSLSKFSLAAPIIINKNNTVIGGHFRLKLLEKKYGKKHEVDVRVANRLLNRTEMEELNVRLKCWISGLNIEIMYCSMSIRLKSLLGWLKGLLKRIVKGMIL